LNETISKRVGKASDVSRYINFCDDKFFHDDSCVYWWSKFPPKSLIVIDEVHQYLGKSFEYGSIDVETELINFLSTHRHGQQELYFLTQHIDQFANQILGIADTLLEIVNVKSLHLPFPISVPMSDFDELKRAFGIKTQYYQANVGNFRGKAVKWSGSTSRHLMSEEVYRVYKSHTKSEESSDRPSLDMSPIEGLVWFARRHAWHLLPKLVGIVSLPFLVYMSVDGFPSFLSAAVVKPEKVSESLSSEKPVSVPSPVPVSPLVPDTQLQKEKAILEQKLIDAENKLRQVELVRSEELSIVMLYPDGILLRNGKKYKVGETLMIEGKEETLECVNVDCGIVRFLSGKTVTF
jgi:hypothetical protein